MHTSFLGLSPLAQDFLKSTKDSFVKRVHRTLETLRCWSEEKMSPTISTRPPLFHIIYPYLFHTICSPWFLGSIKSKDLHMCGSCHQIRRIRFPLEHKTCDILAAERLRLMSFDNRLIIDSFQKAIWILIGRIFYFIQHCHRVNIVATCYPSWTMQMTAYEWTNYHFGRKGKWCAVPELGKKNKYLVT